MRGVPEGASGGTTEFQVFRLKFEAGGLLQEWFRGGDVLIASEILLNGDEDVSPPSRHREVQRSVRNRFTGSPSAVKRFGMESLRNPNRTAVGCATDALETRSVLPSITASAGTN